MLVCERFAFVHLHKSGGTFINQMMVRCLRDTRRIGYHLPYRELPEEFRSLPTLGTVRNPLAYYVSWYHFQAQLHASKRNALFNICSESASLDFAGTIENLVHLHDRPALVERLVQAFPEHYQGFGLNLRKADIRTISGSGRGFYTFLYRRAYEGAPAPTILRQEELRAALTEFLDTRYPGPAQPWRAFLAMAPDLNTSRHRAVLDYYTPALKAKIESSDAEIFAAHRY